MPMFVVAAMPPRLVKGIERKGIAKLPWFADDQASALPGWQESAALSVHAAVTAIGRRVMEK